MFARYLPFDCWPAARRTSFLRRRTNKTLPGKPLCICMLSPLFLDSLLLGLQHSFEPDHMAAVSVLATEQ